MRKLEIVNGPNQGRTLSLTQGSRLVVGRCGTCDFPIMDPRMSRRHFVLEEQGGAWMIRDLSSSNGTWVNSRRINQVMLHDTDTISAGDTIISVISEPDSLQSEQRHAFRNGAHFKTRNHMHGTPTEP